MVNRFSTLMGDDFPYEKTHKTDFSLTEYSSRLIMLWKHAEIKYLYYWEFIKYVGHTLWFRNFL